MDAEKVHQQRSRRCVKRETLQKEHPPAALPAERRVSARRGWAGEKSGHFEHPAGMLSCGATRRIIEVVAGQNSFSAVC